jgi:hypothetical protein
MQMARGPKQHNSIVLQRNPRARRMCFINRKELSKIHHTRSKQVE